MKKFSSVIVTVLVTMLFTTGVVAAGSVIKYKGYPVINVIINGIKLTGTDIPAISMDGKNLMPLKATIEKMDGIVNWNDKTKTATILKPETSIYFILYSEDGNTIESVDNSIPVIDPGKKFYSEVDFGGIPKGTYTIKSQIFDAQGTLITESEDAKCTVDNDNDMCAQIFEWDSIQILPEVYKYKVQMKDSSGVFKTIATKTMRYE